MKVFVGLGNPGNRYKNTRHNTGFILLDKLAGEKELEWKYEKKFDADVVIDSNESFVKPMTHMNNSGESVEKFVKYYKIESDNLIVIHDDADLELGEIRVQKGRGSAGHKGVQNIIDKLGSNDFWRIRIGIGRPNDRKIDTDAWVLTRFSDEELGVISRIDLNAIQVS